MRKIVSACVAACVAILVFWLWPADRSSGDPDKLLLSGETTLIPLLSDLAREFQRSHPHIQIELKNGHSSNGVEDVLSGDAMVGMILDDQAGEITGLSRLTLKQAGVAMIVNRTSGIKRLVRAQVKDLVEDRVNNWQELGGKDSRIKVILPRVGEANRSVFVRYYQLDDFAIRADQVVETDGDVLAQVAASPGAFGVVSLEVARRAKDSSIELLPAGGHAPSAANIETGAYGMVRRASLVTSTSPNPLVVEFIRFVGSPVGRDIIAQH